MTFPERDRTAPSAATGRRGAGTSARRSLVAVAMLALIGAACSSAPADTAVDAGGGITDTAPDQAVRFAECMRDNGVSGFPDPDASGELTVDAIANGSSVDTSSAEFTLALEACKDLEPPGFTGHERDDAEQTGALEFARCIREHGVPDFPDPLPDTPLVDTNRIPSASTDRGMTVLNAAMETCGDLIADQLGDR